MRFPASTSVRPRAYGQSFNRDPDMTRFDISRHLANWGAGLSPKGNHTRRRQAAARGNEACRWPCVPLTEKCCRKKKVSCESVTQMKFVFDYWGDGGVWGASVVRPKVGS